MRHAAVAVVGIMLGFSLSRIGFADWGEVHRMFTFADLRLTFTFAGIWEIPPHALEENASHVQIVDVRERDEFEGPLGRIHGSTLIPLADLPARVGELVRDRPVVTVCRSGARSAQACVLLSRAGFTDVANLSGGMLRWRAEGHAVDGGRD